MIDIYKTNTNSVCNNKSIVQGDKYRFTVLTPQMIRLEYNEEGIFEDRPTQTVINREFEVPQFSLIDEEDNLEIITECVHLIYDKKKFSKNGLVIKVRGNLTVYYSVWNYSEEIIDLKGTARTLDDADGEVEFESGLISRNGFAVIDDSSSLILTDDGWVEPRKKGIVDMYFLGYGREYLTCLKDFFKLTGNTPMLPRYALGNWWSRYYKYTEQEYKELMLRFEKENIPFSVAVIDMDWHLVDIPSKYGSGWTGYTWNKELFNNPKKFMEWLHEKNLRITLNVHPAEGVRAHEEMYVEMAKELGVNYLDEHQIQFDVTNEAFLEAYFKYLHHPNERNGVDFWWIDWQQGSNSKIEGLDPLWMLNHYHYLDNKRNGKRGLILSRYAGIGSHRYPIGFSGDSVISWDSLDFQPYFTANASNVGYGWWSHDIGGHMNGIKDDELATRWVQFGVFSPIMRLHSSASIFNGKEPWRYNKIACETMKEFLQLRHKLLPYIYTMNKMFSLDNLPIIQPMYYHNAEEQKAYEVKNEYYFGTELISCPITKPMNKKLNRGKVKAWLPKGKYIDIFTGIVYSGDRNIDFYRDINSIPVLAKAGSILPMKDMSYVSNSIENPKELEIDIFAGDNGEFILYEDDGETLQYLNGKYVETKMILQWGDFANFKISSAKGDTSLIPEKRDYSLKFRNFTNCNNVKVKINNEAIKAEQQYNIETNTLIIKVKDISVKNDLIVEFNDKIKCTPNDIQSHVFKFLNEAQIEFTLKERIFNIIKSNNKTSNIIGELQTLELERDLFGILCEIILAE